MVTLRRRRRVASVLGLLAAASLALAACSGGTGGDPGGSGLGSGSGDSTSTTSAPSEQEIVQHAFSSAADRTDASGTVWLCRPGLADDPCAGNLDIRATAADGTTSTVPGSSSGVRKADCFYVYPTVSGEKTENSDLQVQGAETFVAGEQAAQFSRYCDVWAPMYHQVTVQGLFHGTNEVQAFQLAARSALAGFRDYLANFNHGRPVVLIGHSQGAAMIIRLLEETMDRNAAERKLLVSALIFGGNVQVPVGKTVGGSFQHIPLCAAPSETGCVVAFSSFLKTPPSDTLFGKPGTGVSVLSGQTKSQHLQVACTNPGALGSTAAVDVTPVLYEGQGAQIPYVSYPDRYTAQCKSANGITWLQITPTTLPGDTRPVVGQDLGPQWGLHIYDVNIAMQNLLDDVGQQIAAYRA